MLKSEVKHGPALLTSIFEDIWNTETTPADWKTGLIAKLSKKGDLSDCNNWKGITLPSLTSKVFSRLIFKRLLEALQTIWRKDQA